MFERDIFTRFLYFRYIILYFRVDRKGPVVAQVDNQHEHSITRYPDNAKSRQEVSNSSNKCSTNTSKHSDTVQKHIQTRFLCLLYILYILAWIGVWTAAGSDLIVGIWSVIQLMQ
jgi:hypothetical protein